jgi:hypothetical protein
MAPEGEAEDGCNSRADSIVCFMARTARTQQKIVQKQRPPGIGCPDQRVIAHTYHYHHQQPYNNEHVQHPPNHAYQHHQEVQVLPPPPPHHPNPQHHNHPQAPKQEDFAEQPYRGVIHMITGGSSVDFEMKRQKRDHYRSVNHVALIGPVVQHTVVSCTTHLRRQGH